MKVKSHLLSYVLILGLLLVGGVTQAEPGKTFSHVIIVWLKEPGNEAMRKKFVTASEQLNTLPGIINRHVGFVDASDRKIDDDSFDVAVTVTLKDKAAYDAYMVHPKHQEIVDQHLKPLVDKIIGYNFVSK